MSTKTVFRILFVASALSLFAVEASAKMQCWTNKDGVRECGNVVPPEYAQNETKVLDERGITTEVVPRAKSSAELELERQLQEREDARRAEEALQLKEQKAYDRVLLSTFLSEKEILAARDRKISTIDGAIELTTLTIDKLQANLDGERKKAANSERAGKKIPESVQESIASLESQIADKRNFISVQEKEKSELRAKYAADLDRFRELKGIKPPTPAPEIAPVVEAPADTAATPPSPVQTESVDKNSGAQ